MRKYDEAKVNAALLAEGQASQQSVNDHYLKVTQAERRRIYDMGYEQALRDYRAGPFAKDSA